MLIDKAGYDNFAAQKTRQEKFLIDLADSQKSGSMLEDNLFGDLNPTAATEVFIAADEFGNFIGAGNTDFMSILGDLWDYEGTFKYRLKNSDSVQIYEPCINILGGITASEFHRVFPPEALGQGFFSRLVIIHDEPTGIKLTIPPDPDPILEKELLVLFKNIKKELQGQITMNTEAYTLLDKIYKTYKGIPDQRFEHYNNRRQSHLIKLTMVIAASRLSKILEKDDLVHANTLLTMAEYLMPKALGEFGKGRHSEITHKIIQLLSNAHEPYDFKSLWQHVHTDLDRRDQLVEIIQNLVMADKIQTVEGGWLSKKVVIQEVCSEGLDWDILTDNERKLLRTVKDE